QDRAGAYAGAKKYGNAANLPEAVAKAGRYANKRALSSPSPGGGGPRAARGGVSSTGGARGKDRDPLLPSMDEVLNATATAKVHKPHLDEMHGPESLPYRSGRALPQKPAPVGGTKIFQPTNSRESGPEFGPSPRSSGGAPGKRGGWKRR